MNKQHKEKLRVGDLRPSQLLHTFGVGAIVELPHLSVMVMGLDDWPVDRASSEIHEPRLLRAVHQQLGEQVTRLMTPPVMAESIGLQAGPFDDAAQIGVPVAPFPRWLVCPACRLLAPIQSDLFVLKPDFFRKERTRHVHRNCIKAPKPPAAIPARFLVACENGHLDDFPWVEYVHRGRTDCKYELHLYELGASGEVADIQVQCKCGKKRRMSDAYSDSSGEQLPACRGRLPHLRKYADQGCKKAVKGILLGASNSWFPMMMSALSIPTAVDKLGKLIEQNWGELEECESAREVKLKRKLLHGLSAWTDEQIWEATDKKKTAPKEEEKEPRDLREPEWRILSAPDPRRNSRDFQLREVAAPRGYELLLEKVVLVERLREVGALVGFTRIESPGDYTEIGEMSDEKRVPISRTAPRWVPTSDTRGEGIFLQFSEAAIRSWLKRVDRQSNEFYRGHKQWRASRKLHPVEGNFPGMRYVLLHSLAHAMIRQFSLECGYTTASIRERIYSRNAGEDGEAMAGILLYTAAPDSEGTLGGLVSLGEPQTLGRHLDQALESAHLCTSDPLCAEHQPLANSLHAAACHACMFLPETSCERGNRYLDRAVLISTVEHADYAFFTDFAEALPTETIVAESDPAASPAQPLPISPAVAEALEFCDERYQDFLQSWAARGLPLPVVGYELMDAGGRISSQAEFAWPDRKIAILLPENADERPAFEALEWRVFPADDLKNIESQLQSALKE